MCPQSYRQTEYSHPLCLTLSFLLIVLHTADPIAAIDQIWRLNNRVLLSEPDLTHYCPSMLKMLNGKVTHMHRS